MYLEILVGIVIFILGFIAYKVNQINSKTRWKSWAKDSTAKEVMKHDFKKFDYSLGEIPIETTTKIQTMDGDVHISSETIGKSDVSDLTDKVKNLKGKQ